MSLPDGIIQLVIKKVISKSNEKIDFDSLISNIGSIHDVDKKLVIRITDMKVATGLGIQDGKMIELEKVDKPDTVFSMDKNSFSAIILNKLDHRQAFFLGAIEADGENWIRDGVLLGKVFDKIREVMGTKK